MPKFVYSLELGPALSVTASEAEQVQMQAEDPCTAICLVPRMMCLTTVGVLVCKQQQL